MLGFVMKEDEALRRCYIADIIIGSTASTFPCWRSKLIGAFILCIDDDIVGDLAETEAALSA
jgi:hypothetical protein